MTTMMRSGLRLLAALLCLASATPAAAQQEEGSRIDSLSSRVRRLQREVDNVEQGVSSVRTQVWSVERELSDLRDDYGATDYAPGGLLLFFIGAFCALWAQNTGRSAWLWFFLGLFFHMITLLVLLAKNAGDRRSLPPPAAVRVPTSRTGW
jgi:outer membrane murein-binding lipoprotein Lpp